MNDMFDCGTRVGPFPRFEDKEPVKHLDGVSGSAPFDAILQRSRKQERPSWKGDREAAP